MRPTLTIMLLALLLQACGPIRQMQKVQSQVPILGCVGKHRSSLFKKDFQKMGEPELDRPISVSFESIAFSNGMKSRYEKYREHTGMQPLAKTMDSTQLENLTYYQLKISDVVHLADELNQDKNSSLTKYLQEDTGLVLLSGMSFVAGEELGQRLKNAEKLFLRTNINGALELVIDDVKNHAPIQISALEIFDFETAAFCWNKDKRGQLNIAHILMDGGNCPGNTEANPEKLNKIPDYLKL